MSIAHLEPTALWSMFDQLTQIPRPSKHEERVIEWVKQLGREHQFVVQQDHIGNLRLQKGATEGREKRQGIIFQSHLDMVCQANASTNHDFMNDPIQTEVIDGWVHAKGTTLGADNGIGVATILAIFCSTEIPHGPIEALLTVDEEAGMTGAHELKGGWFTGELLLNLDSEEWGEFCVGCAGGIDISASLPLERAEPMPDGIAYQLSVTGLKGGHSGIDIHKGRGNANKLLARALRAVYDAAAVDVISINGGTLRNAIPREAFAEIRIAADEVLAVDTAVKEIASVIGGELAIAAPELKIELKQVEHRHNFNALTEASLMTLIIGIENTLSGVERWSDSVEGVVETSNNFAIINTDDAYADISCLTRSLIDSGRDEMAQRVARFWQSLGASTRISGEYPGWAPNPQSSLVALVQSIYENKTGEQAQLSVLHAGLECGLFAKPYPNWDMVSLGPNIRGAHSPDERCDIESTAKYFDLVLDIVDQIPEK